MRAVMLDAASLGDDIDLSPLETLVDEFTAFAATTPDEVESRIQDAEIVFTNKVVLDELNIANAPKLRLICVLATGVNNVDLDAARAHNIAVKNVAAYGTASVAQHTLSLMLALATRLPRYTHSVQHGEWQAADMFCLMQHPVMQLQGKTLVLVGHGELGREVERLAEAFGMTVKVAARPGRGDDPRPSFESLLPTADVISFHCPLTETTRDLLDASSLAKCQAHTLIVNCARGGIVNETDALAALRAGQIGGLAVDVLTEEPPRHGNPLLDAINDGLNLIVTPHSAWLAPEARQRIVALSADNVTAFLNGS